MATGASEVDASRVPDLTIRTVARGFFQEADRYGFREADYLRFMSSLIDITNEKLKQRGPRGRDAVSGSAVVEAPLVRIRSFAPATDQPLLERWVADAAGRDFLLARSMSRPLTPAEMVSDPRSIIGIITALDDTPCGAMAFLDFDPLQRKAEMRKLIGEPELRGRGYGKAATRLWLRYGFAELNLHKIYLSTLDTNLRNIRLNERLGFRLEGILHDEVLIDGRYHDVLRMAIWEDPAT